MEPKLLRKSNQKLDRPRGAAKGLPGGAKGAQEEPRGAQGRAKEEPRGGQEWPSRVQGGAKGAQRGTEEEPSGPKGVPREPMEMAWRRQGSGSPKGWQPTSQDPNLKPGRRHQAEGF